jgi:ribose transport system ATP-binding protein
MAVGADAHQHEIEQGAGVIMISSDLPEVLGMSDRVLVMRAGAVQADLSAADATESAVLQAALGIAS